MKIAVTICVLYLSLLVVSIVGRVLGAAGVSWLVRRVEVSCPSLQPIKLIDDTLIHDASISACHAPRNDENQKVAV